MARVQPVPFTAKDIKGGGTVMFAFLALAGDLGCSGGPFLVGIGVRRSRRKP